LIETQGRTRGHIKPIKSSKNFISNGGNTMYSEETIKKYIAKMNETMNDYRAVYAKKRIQNIL
jgi:hypothetical protein